MSKPILTLSPEKLRDFQQWREINDDGFSVWDYLFAVSNVEVAIAYTKLFWPDFIEHEGGIFLSETFNRQIYNQWKAKLGNDRSAIERVINHQHLDDILPGSEAVGWENLLYLGQIIAQMWSSRLQQLYPQRRFEVNCNEEEYNVIVTFYQV